MLFALLFLCFSLSLMPPLDILSLFSFLLSFPLVPLLCFDSVQLGSVGSAGGAPADGSVLVYLFDRIFPGSCLDPHRPNP